ncbi:thioesterase II family protein [Micromonospora sp. CA-259024]|uniref:thioesterase II family protein n=1 Tax=Micromonospora sp. CA-259024 TaxID=3239965 RepID=UPI003D8BE1CE
MERHAGFDLLHLFVSGRRAPSRVRAENLHELGDDAILAELRRHRATDDRLLADRDLLRMILPVLRGDYRAIETYRERPGSRVRCPLSVLVGDVDPLVPPDEAEAWRAYTHGPDKRPLPPGRPFLPQRPARRGARHGHGRAGGRRRLTATP